MPQGSKEKYTDKQRRQADHIKQGYIDQGVSTEEAETRAWATVNAMSGGGEKSGSGRGKPTNKAPARKGGQKGAASRTKADRSAAGKKAAQTRKRRAGQAGKARSKQSSSS